MQSIGRLGFVFRFPVFRVKVNLNSIQIKAQPPDTGDYVQIPGIFKDHHRFCGGLIEVEVLFTYS